MQSWSNVGRSLVHIVFRGGSAQRLHYSNQRYGLGLALLLLFGIATQLLVFDSDPIETGLFVFVCFTSLYIAGALLTRRVPRNRLRVSLLGAVLIAAAALAPLLLLAPWAGGPAWLRNTAAFLAGALAFVGIGNCLRYALHATRAVAYGYVLGFALVISLFFAVMYNLLGVVFA